MNEADRVSFGIDFGGTSVKLGLCDQHGSLLAKVHFDTSTASDPASWIEACADRLPYLLAAAGRRLEDVQGVGIGVPGFVDFQTGVVYTLPNVPGWEFVPLATRLRERLNLPVWVDNDVNAMALGEVLFGAGHGRRHAVFVTLGTGVGGGILLNGDIFRGAFSMGGELGHVSIAVDGVRSSTGVGGLEQYIGNQALSSRARQAINDGATSSLREIVERTPHGPTPREIAEAASAGDAVALHVFDFAARCLATALASVTYLIQPEVFIIGGGVAQSGPVLFDPLLQHLRDRLHPAFMNHLSLVPAALGPDAGLIGSASLVWKYRLG